MATGNGPHAKFFDPAAEASLLGSLTHSDILAELASEIDPLFFSPPRDRVFLAVCDLAAAQEPVDFRSLGRKLTSETLAALGGPAGLSALLLDAPHSLPIARQLIGELREKYRCRELQRAGETLLAEIASGDQEAAEHALAKIGSLRFQARNQNVEILESRRFDFANPPPDPPTIFKLGDHTICTPENFTMLQAKVKAGKTAAVGAMIGATLSRGGDFFGFSSENLAGKAVIHFDTEQSRFHHHWVIRRALARSGATEPPPWLRSYYVKGLGYLALLDALRAEMERAKKEHGGIHAVFLDGIGDFSPDVNDPPSSFALVSEIERLAVQYFTVFICILHENPGTETGKTRGHLGSHLERKAETNLRLEKNGDGETVIFSDRSRTCHIPKNHGFSFAWDAEKQIHVSVTASPSARETKKEALSRELLKSVFSGVPSSVGLSWSQFVAALEALDFKNSTARRKITEWIAEKFIRQHDERYFLGER